MAIMSPRTIPEVVQAYEKIDYVDKGYFRWFTEKEALAAITKFMKEHPQYTHLCLTGDDTIPSENVVANLIADMEAHPEIEVISAVIGLDKFAGDNRLSVTIEPATDKEMGSHLQYNDYRRLPYEFTEMKGILQCWYQGFAFTLMTRRILETIGIKTWFDGNAECMSDLKFSYDLAQAKIPQYVDLRTFMWHLRSEVPKNNDYTIRNKMYGKSGACIDFIPAKRELKGTPAPIVTLEQFPKLKDLYDIIFNKYTSSLKICFVTEFSQETYFQWYKAFTMFSQTHDFVLFSDVEMRPQTLKYSPDVTWQPIREADVVYCYIACRSIRDTEGKIWKWWEELPKRCRALMRPEAKLIVQYDDELQFVVDKERRSWNFGWEKDKEYMDLINSLTPETFFPELFSLADAYFTVVDNPPWAKYCNKPIYYMPLPQLLRYPMLNTYWSFWTYLLKIPIVEQRHNRVAILHHSFRKSDLTHSIPYIGRPVALFTSRNTNHAEKTELLKTLPAGSAVIGNIPLNQYVQLLSQEKVALDDNLDYDGWSRFAMECAIMFVPCVGSSIAIREFFPDLYTAPKDYAKQKMLIDKLFTDKDFYLTMALRGQKRVLYKLNEDRLCETFLKYIILDLGCPVSPLTGTQAIDNVIFHFARFLATKAIPYYNIPPKPHKGNSVFDSISRRNLNEEEWENLYGRWSVILNDPILYRQARRKALQLKNLA